MAHIVYVKSVSNGHKVLPIQKVQFLGLENTCASPMVHGFCFACIACNIAEATLSSITFDVLFWFTSSFVRSSSLFSSSSSSSSSIIAIVILYRRPLIGSCSRLKLQLIISCLLTYIHTKRQMEYTHKYFSATTLRSHLCRFIPWQCIAKSDY